MKIKLHYILFLVASLFAISANGAAITGYSVNSDSGSENQDSLYRIDMPSGVDDLVGRLIASPEIPRDTEGLAFSSENELWGIDDLTRTLFRINTSTGAIIFGDERPLDDELPIGGSNDFGMTFACDDTLYITSVTTNTLYDLALDGNARSIGNLDAPISAIAAIGNPTRLYGLGNGLDKDGNEDSPYLFRINIDTGKAEKFDEPLGIEAGAYNQAGLAFDSNGTLWAITDRRSVGRSIDGLPSQVLRIDEETGVATFVAETNEVGFESLAIVAPTQCQAQDNMAEDIERIEPIPTLSGTGRMFTIFILMFSGLVILRRHLS